MHILNDSGTYPRAHSNIVCDCPHCKAFDYADTVITPRRHAKPSTDDTLPSAQPRPKVQLDDCIKLHCIDTETFEHTIEYVAPDGTVIATQTVSARQWKLYQSPFSQRRPPLRKGR